MKDSSYPVKTTVKKVIHEGKENIIIFGGAGAGKSSLINLLAGKNVASTSNKAHGCTLESSSYEVHMGEKKLQLFDTMGLNEPDMSGNGHLDAIVKAYQLIHRLENSGGVQLLVFCMRAGRITKTIEQNWKLFHDILCDKKVPAVIVITGLEQVDPMEQWWTENEKLFTLYGIIPVGQACVTLIPGLGGIYQEKYRSSEQKVRDLLLKHCEDLGYSIGGHTWFIQVARFIRKLTSHPPSKFDMQRALRKKCGLSRVDAEKLVQRFDELTIAEEQLAQR